MSRSGLVLTRVDTCSGTRPACNSAAMAILIPSAGGGFIHWPKSVVTTQFSIPNFLRIHARSPGLIRRSLPPTIGPLDGIHQRKGYSIVAPSEIISLVYLSLSAIYGVVYFHKVGLGDHVKGWHYA